MTTKAAGGPNNPVDKGQYKLITSGTCADYGADDIASLADCTKAIGVMYGTLGKDGEDGKVKDRTGDTTDFFPKGCAAYYRGYPPPGTTLGWTTTTTPRGVWSAGFYPNGRGPCDWWRHCICRNKGKGTRTRTLLVTLLCTSPALYSGYWYCDATSPRVVGTMGRGVMVSTIICGWGMHVTLALLRSERYSHVTYTDPSARTTTTTQRRTTKTTQSRTTKTSQRRVC